MKALDPSARTSRPEFDVHLTETVMVTMRDGMRLATDIYGPARDGRPLAGSLTASSGAGYRRPASPGSQDG